MCGFAGIYNFGNKKEIDSNSLRTMSEVISHRGPDDEGFFIDEKYKIGLAHRRLSIIDISSGKQPMKDYHGHSVIAYNGELYNYPALKKELIGKGYKFNTNSDTEVLLNFYLEYGVVGLQRLNGIFAFAIFNFKDGSLTLCRDRFGVKPLYYSIQNGSLIFGSEIKSILSSEYYNKKLDLNALSTFLTYRYNPSPETLFEGINKLTPGHFLKISMQNEYEIESFIHDKPVHSDYANLSFDELQSEYLTYFSNAVKRQLISDVPVGLFLSGGVDSALLGHYMQQHYTKGRINSFTVGFEDNGEFNELEDAKESSKFINSEHHEIIISKKQYRDFFLDSFHYTEEPIAEPTISALYYVSKLASEQLKVVLAGQGADEPLAGYKRYLGEFYINRFRKLISIFPTILDLFLKGNERWRRTKYAVKFRNELDRFIAIYSIFTPEMKSQLFKNQFNIYTPNSSYIKSLYDNTSSLNDPLSKMLYIDTRMCLSDNLLLFNDKITMSNSLEMRVPFLDNELINFIETLSIKYKLRGFNRKYIHKTAASKVLPKNIVQRKKKGFETPIEAWLKKDYYKEMVFLFEQKDSLVSEIFEKQKLMQFLEANRKGTNDYKNQIFTLLSLELWYQNFFLKN